MFKRSAICFFTCLLNIHLLTAAPVWQKGDVSVVLEDNTLSLFNQENRIVQIIGLEFNFIKAQSIVLESVSRDTIRFKLTLEGPDGFYNNFPKEVEMILSHSGNGFHFYAEHPTFQHITIELEDQNEQYFGLIEKLYPGNRKDPNLRGQTVDVDVYGLGNQDYAENYASAYSAFYMSTAGYGSFFDTFAKGRYQFAVDGKTQIEHQTRALDWYIFYGKNGTDIHRAYFEVIGRPKFVPIWACGPIFWRDQNDGGSDEVLDDIREFTALEIPLTACWIDRPFSEGANEWSKMNFNRKFAEPESWIKEINQRFGLELMTWVGPLTFEDQNFPGLLPGYPSYIDLTNPEALKELEKRLNEGQYQFGVQGHKMDRADEHFPLTVPWHEPAAESETRNKYIYLYAKVIHEFLTRAHGEDQFNFARAAFHRSQPFLSAVWGGDCRTNWLGMQGNQANAMRCGFMGFPIWGTDTGGYLGNGKIDDTLYIRWLQWGMWNGLFEIKIDGSGGSGKDRAPWHCSEQLQKTFREICQWRMELLPTIYSYVNTSYKNGVVMKPLVYVYPKDEKTWHNWDEYIFGDAFLIAPVFTSENTREIYLPQGDWIALHESGKLYTGPQTLTAQVPLDKIPVFLKTNSIYVTGDIYQGNSVNWDDQFWPHITIHLTPGKLDEKTDFDYVDYFDGNREKSMRLENHTDCVEFTSGELNADVRLELCFENKPGKVTLNGQPAQFQFNPGQKKVIVQIPRETGIDLIVEK